MNRIRRKADRYWYRWRMHRGVFFGPSDMSFFVSIKGGLSRSSESEGVMSSRTVAKISSVPISELSHCSEGDGDGERYV